MCSARWGGLRPPPTRRRSPCSRSIIILKPKDKWRPGVTKADIVSELDAKLQQIPGVRNGWTQPIINRINMLSTGVRTDLGVKIFGNDLNVLKDLAVQAEGILKTVPGAADVVAERVTGGNYHRHRHRPGGCGPLRRQGGGHPGRDRDRPGGGELSPLRVEGRDRFPIRIRYLRDFRDNIPAIRRILVAGSGRRPGAAVTGDQDQDLHRRAGDHQRGGAPPLHRLSQRAGPGHGRLCHRGADRCWRSS